MFTFILKSEINYLFIFRVSVHKLMLSIHICTYRQAHRQTYRITDIHTDIKPGIQANIQTYTLTIRNTKKTIINKF